MYNKTVSRYIVETVNKVKWQVKAHFFDSKEPISITGLIATIKFAFDTDRIHEKVEM